MTCAIKQLPMAHQWRIRSAPLLPVALIQNQWRLDAPFAFGQRRTNGNGGNVSPLDGPTFEEFL